MLSLHRQCGHHQCPILKSTQGSTGKDKHHLIQVIVTKVSVQFIRITQYLLRIKWGSHLLSHSSKCSGGPGTANMGDGAGGWPNPGRSPNPCGGGALVSTPQALAQMLVGYFARVVCMGVVGYPIAQRQMPYRPHAFIPYPYFLDT